MYYTIFVENKIEKTVTQVLLLFFKMFSRHSMAKLPSNDGPYSILTLLGAWFFPLLEEGMHFSHAPRIGLCGVLLPIYWVSVLSRSS